MSYNILVADNSNKTRQNIVKSLKQIGVSKTTEAADGEQAINLFQKGQFDLVLTDWNLSTPKGENVVQQIRMFNKEVPIIATSTASQKNGELEAKQTGASDFLVKPFSNELLREKIERFLGATAG
jgi:two-component system chemotaxis response regulator CheY